MRKILRIKKHQKIRQRIRGTKDRPRLAVFKSRQHLYAQLIDDSLGKTLAAVSDLKITKNDKKKKAYEAGKNIAEKAVKLKLKKVVFDRGGFLYHGRIAEFAKGAREGGLDF